MLDFDIQVGRMPVLPARAAKQTAFAISKALNATIKQVQEAERNRIKSRFTLRRPQFVLRTVKIERGDFATKRKLVVKIGIDPTRDILAKFEKGGTKRARQAPELSIPVEARRTKTGVVSRAQRPTALGFPRSQRRRPRRGKKRTYLIPGVGIFQRFGRGGARRSRLLFAFVRQVKIPKLLGFEDTARRVIRNNFAKNFSRAFKNALRTAR